MAIAVTGWGRAGAEKFAAEYARPRSTRYPYGETRLDGGGLPTDRRFIGEREEKALGIYSLGARFYDPVLARFLSPDTIVPEPGNPQSLNRYSYSLANPLRYIDRTGHDVCGYPCSSVWQLIKEAIAAAGPLAVAGAPEGATIAGTTISVAGLAYYGSMWAMEDNGPDYLPPEAFDAGTIGATYPLPGTSTLRMQTTLPPLGYLAAGKAVQSMADHLGFAFGYQSNGLPGFPDPFKRHDPKKENSLKGNGEHIRNALQGIKDNLGRGQNLTDFLKQSNLSEAQVSSLTEHLDYLASDLQNQGHLYEQFGSKLSGQILDLLKDVGYVAGS